MHTVNVLYHDNIFDNKRRLAATIRPMRMIKIEYKVPSKSRQRI